MKRFLKKILVKLRILDRQSNHKESIRKDVEVIPVQPNLEFVVYWKVLEVGKGPALILKAYGKEILKFDCFGKNDGHFHAAPDYGKRIFFEEQTASAQIEQTESELKANAQFYLESQEEVRIRKIKIDQENFKTAIDVAKKKLNHFLQTIPELEEIR